MTKNTLPAVVQAHIDAVNAFDTDAVVATFTDDALWGRDAIRTFITKEIVGDRVTMDITEVTSHDAMTIVRARYDGNYDKTNLPADLVLTNYFVLRDAKIVTLIIVRVA